MHALESDIAWQGSYPANPNSAMSIDQHSQRFGDLLQHYRTLAGLSQQELAERAGLSQRGISDLERGVRRAPYPATVRRLVKALGLAPSDRATFLEAAARKSATRAAAPEAEPDLTEPLAPQSLTSFFGREQELRHVQQLLRKNRLVTLAGPGGIGKTRLALEVVTRCADDYSDGARLVDLAAVADPLLVNSAVAAAAEIPESVFASHDTGTRVPNRQLLLVLDNCEHLIDACAWLAARLLQIWPRLTMVATSREPLSIDGEIIWRVPPLGLPDPARLSQFEPIANSAAVQLFVDRARAVQPSFGLYQHNASAVARICVRLDAIPLALELAAARVSVMPPEQLEGHLERDPRLLARRSRTSALRQQTIEATIAWSYDLLSTLEQALFRRLAVCAGGCTFEAVAAICPGGVIESDQVLELLTLLVHKSLVQVDHGASQARYRLLEPIRQYALLKLEESGEGPECRARHAAWFLNFAERNEAPRAGSNEAVALDRLEAEHDNLRAALHWCLARAEPETALRLVAALFRFWDRRGYLVEGSYWTEAALEPMRTHPAHCVAES